MVLCGPFLLPAEDVPVADRPIVIELIRDLPIPFFPMVEATIEGRTGLFLVDTGAQSTLLTPAFSDALGLERSTREGSVRGSETPHAPENSTVETVDLAGIDLAPEFRLDPVRAYVHNLDPLERLLKKPVAGIIGMDLLAQQTLRFDFPNRRLEFHPQPIRGIPVRALWHENRAYVKVLLDGVAVPFVVDTASSRTMVAPDIWEQISADKEVFTEERLTVGVSGAQTDARSFVVVENFDMAPLLLKQVRVMSGPRNVLGLSVLEKFSVTFVPEKNAIVFSNPQIEKALRATPDTPTP